MKSLVSDEYTSYLYILVISWIWTIGLSRIFQDCKTDVLQVLKLKLRFQ